MKDKSFKFLFDKKTNFPLNETTGLLDKMFEK